MVNAFPFLKKFLDPGLAAASGSGGMGMGGGPDSAPEGSSSSSGTGNAPGEGMRAPFDWQDEDFQKSLGEAWMNNDLAAGYAKAIQGTPAATGKVGQQRQMQPWEMPGSLFAASPMSYNPFIKKRQS